MHNVSIHIFLFYLFCFIFTIYHFLKLVVQILSRFHVPIHPNVMYPALIIVLNIKQGPLMTLTAQKMLSVMKERGEQST